MESLKLYRILQVLLYQVICSHRNQVLFAAHSPFFAFSGNVGLNRDPEASAKTLESLS